MAPSSSADPMHADPQHQIEQLEQALLRAEQQQFDWLDTRARAIEQREQEQQQREQEQQQHMALRNLQLQQAQEELHTTLERLAWLEPLEAELALRTLQLQQAQEELHTTLARLQVLETWQHQLRFSLKRQLLLSGRCLATRLSDRLRWILPASLVRRQKERLKRLLRRR